MLVKLKSARAKRSRANSILVEPLESRTYYDLVPAVVGTLPESVVATVKTADVITVDLTNNGATTIKGAYSLELFVSPDGSLGDATPILTLNKNLAPLGAGKTRAMRVDLGAFPLVSNGSYNILAQVSGPLAGDGDDVAVSAGTVSVADPFVDLTDSLAFSGDTSRDPGQTYSEELTVTNLGNVAAKGTLEIDAGYSLSSDGSSPMMFAAVNKAINLAAGKSVTLHYTETISVGTTPGVYFGVVNIDPGNTFGETSTDNNFAVTTNSLTVLDPYPNIIGTFSGSYDFFAGLSKGTTGTLNIVITSEDDTTGDVTGTGTSSNGADFAFTGTITPNGVVTLSGEDDDAACSLSARFSNGKLTGTMDIPSKMDKGEFSLTEE